MKVGKLITGLVSGAAIGAAIGLLFAPKKGADTRKLITESGDSYLKGAKGKIDNLSDSLNQKVEAIKERSKSATSDSKAEEKYHDTKADIHDMRAS
ncbi:YtxH domain-containing protein [Gillisia sp. JM1]|uniref:YtxH domain-containing protein n=1 Tax=Gillisia sp. JM1 TaxID=1283286 RepID=UPI0004145A21|nr:YtxH domain-containing protein [Gillisia sp. JM1]